MDTSTVENDLNTRIEQSRAWLISSPSPLTNIQFREKTWSATPVAFLDDPGRVERYGVAFQFSLDNQSKTIRVLLKVRIKPEATVGNKGDSSPYIVIYISNQALGADDAITWHHIDVPASYTDLIGLSIEDWYQKWIAHALACKGARKIFDPEMAIID